MYFAVIQQFIRTLKNFEGILSKATQFAEVRKFDAKQFADQRLFVDMLPFSVQIQIVTDVAKGCASALVGKEAPKFEDNETTMPELVERVQKCIRYLESFHADDFANLTPSTIVKLSYPAGKGMYPEEFVFGRAIPNFFFHVTTAYNILRANGVEIGKKDFLGDLRMFDV